MKRPVVIGIVAVAVVVLGAGVVFAATSGGGSDGSAGPKTTHTTTTTKPSKSDGTTSSTKAGAGTEPSTVDRSVPPDPKNAYQPVPVPAGMSATIATCTWSPTNGGELEARGTITNTAGQDDVWLITAVWLQKNQAQNEAIDLQSDVISLGTGMSAPWHLSISASSAPPNLSCALEIE